MIRNATLVAVAVAMATSGTLAQSSVDAGEVVRGVRRAPARRYRRAPRVPPSVRRAPAQAILARLAWLEAGAHVSAGEVAAFHAVIENRRAAVEERRGTRISYQAMAWGYSVALRNPRRAWVHRLGAAPLSPSLPPYVREEWPRVYAEAGRAIAGDVTPSCDRPGRLLHWGSPTLDADNIRRFLRRGYHDARCGYHNTFLARSR